MQVCIVGYYFWEDFYKQIEAQCKINAAHKPFVISHRSRYNTENFLKKYQIPYYCRYNVGLEWGAYNWFLHNKWNGWSNVFFCHDDVFLHGEGILDGIDSLDGKFDQCYIFKSREEDRINGGKHGRGIFMSAKFLLFAKKYPCKCKFCTLRYKSNLTESYYVDYPHIGFYYDRYNFGFTKAARPTFTRDYNQGIAHFHNYLGKVRDMKALDTSGERNSNMRVVGRVYIPEFDSAKRGGFNRYPRGLGGIVGYQ